MEERTTRQSLAALVASGFLILGILGFVPGVTSDYARLELAGRDSRAELFGVFDVSVLHNLLHVAIGAAGLGLVRSLAGTRSFLFYGGAACLVLWLFGMIVDRGDEPNFVPVDAADGWLHLALGLTMLSLGALIGRQRATP